MDPREIRNALKAVSDEIASDAARAQGVIKAADNLRMMLGAIGVYIEFGDNVTRDSYNYALKHFDTIRLTL